MFNLPFSVTVALASVLVIAAYAGFVLLVSRWVRQQRWDEHTIPRSQVIPFRPLPRHIDRKKKYLVLVARAKHMGLSREER